MKQLLFIAAFVALVVAKPETYKETEDFQYSRSSSDDGTKSGYYGAQRGNVGGNYEKAHNMDSLAQNQLSGAVRQVEGELGDGANMRSGNAFTSANSRGSYGSGHYDLTNLQGRNFQEGTSFGNSQSTSSHNAFSTSSQNSAYRGVHGQNSRYTGYNGVKNGQSSSNLQASDNAYGAGANNYESHSSQSNGYSAQSGYNSQNGYDSRSNQYSGVYSNPQSRVIVTTPVRIVGRPGQRVAVPVGVQTYDAHALDQNAHSYDASASTHDHSAQAYNSQYSTRNHNAQAYDATHASMDHNAINSDAEVLSNGDHQTNYRPAGIPKSYESSYSYRKQWEKHDTKPVILSVPSNPVPTNSELYEDTRASSLTSDSQHLSSGSDSHSGHSSSAYNGYNSNVKSTSAQSRYNSGYNSQHSASGASSDSHTHGAANYGSPATDTNTKPKSYQSSYSYHKAWERQGDPYEIKPVSNGLDGQESQRLTATKNQYGWNQRNNHQVYSHGSLVDCDCDEYGNVRVARSAPQYQQSQNYDSQEDLGQQVQQNQWSNLEDLGQQSQNKWDYLKDLGQQSQTTWNTQGQRANENLEYLGQQTQTSWNTQEQRANEHLEDLGQQTQNGWYDSQQSQNNRWDKLQIGGQQALNIWDTPALEQQAQTDLGQQTQDTWDKIDEDGDPDKLEDFGQQTQGQLDLEQQIQDFKAQEDQKQDKDDRDSKTFIEQETQLRPHEFQISNQHSDQRYNDSTSQNENVWDKLESLQTQNKDQNINQETQSGIGDEHVNNLKPNGTWNSFSEISQQNNNNYKNQQRQNIHDINQESQSGNGNEQIDKFKQRENSVSHTSQGDNNNHQVQNVWDIVDGFQQQNTDHNINQETEFGNGTRNSLSHISQDEFQKQYKDAPYFNQETQSFIGHSNESNHNWHQVSQSNEDLGQQTQGFWGDFLRQDNVNSTTHQVKPVWEQSEDNIQQTSQNADAFIHSHGYGHFWSLNEQNNTNTNFSQQSHTTYNNHNLGQGSDHNSWQDQSSSNDNTLHSNNNSQPGSTGSSLQSLWDKLNNLEQTFSKPSNEIGENKNNSSTSHTSSSQSSHNYQQTQHSESTSNIGFSQSSYHDQVGGNYDGYRPGYSLESSESTGTNIKPNNEEKETHTVEVVRPQDIGRGDIGPEDSLVPETIENLNNQSSNTFVSNNKPYKTPVEIETLSLTKETNKSTINESSNAHEIYLEENIQQTQDKMNVLSLQNQKALEDQRKLFNDQNNTNVEQGQEEIQQQNLGPPDQQSESLDQQNVFDWGQNSNDQQTQTAWEPNQKSEAAWGQNKQDFGQQVQTLWTPQEAIQQDTQEFENLGRSNHGQYQMENFYSEKYNSAKDDEQQSIQRVVKPDLQNSPKADTSKLENPAPEEVTSTIEPTTEKPGFWKSVGSKFTSAKDKVSSWFSRS